MTEIVRAACIIGWPVEHSRSPLIHNYWLKTYGIAGEYRREAVAPDRVRRFHPVARRARLCRRQCHGAAQGGRACALSQPDDRARAVGAANTLWFDGGLRSTNTDVEGFLSNLDACAPGLGSHLDQNRGARRRRRGARRRLRAADARRAKHHHRQPHAEPRRCFARALRRTRARRALGRTERPAQRCGAVRQYDDARHGRAAGTSPPILGGCPVTPLSPIWSMCR